MTTHKLTSVARAFALAAGLSLLSGGCHLLDITNPDIVPGENLNSPLALPTIRAGAIGDFTLAYSGSGASGSQGTVEGQIMISGLMADEWVNTETFPDRVQADARQVDPSSATFSTVFRNLARARLSAENAAAKFRQLADTTTDAGLSELLSLAGFTYTLFAENYCSGVPFSNPNPDGTVRYGVPLTTSQMLDTAIERFNEALVAALALPAASRGPWVALAAVGKARALLDSGDVVAADTVASTANVSTTFSYVVQHSLNSTREQNGVFNAVRNFKRYGVPSGREGGNGLDWRSVAAGQDPRTPIVRAPSTNKGFDGVTPQYDQLRYVDRKASVTLATGLEARLINAEAGLRRGDTTGFMTQLNGLRASPPAYILAGDTTNVTAQGNPVAAMPPLAWVKSVRWPTWRCS